MNPPPAIDIRLPAEVARALVKTLDAVAGAADTVSAVANLLSNLMPWAFVVLVAILFILAVRK
jgi:hypothetical protein